jgi:hypothetical protein
MKTREVIMKPFIVVACALFSLAALADRIDDPKRNGLVSIYWRNEKTHIHGFPVVYQAQTHLQGPFANSIVSPENGVVRPEYMICFQQQRQELETFLSSEKRRLRASEFFSKVVFDFQDKAEVRPASPDFGFWTSGRNFARNFQSRKDDVGSSGANTLSLFFRPHWQAALHAQDPKHPCDIVKADKMERLLTELELRRKLAIADDRRASDAEQKHDMDQQHFNSVLSP